MCDLAQLSLGPYWSGVQFISGSGLGECPPGSQSILLCLRLGLVQGALETLKEFPWAHALLQILLTLFSLGTRPGPNLVRGNFSLSEMLCLILGALLFLVLVILVTQMYRWRAKHRGGLQGVQSNIESVWRQEMGPGVFGGGTVFEKLHLPHMKSKG